MRRTKKIAALLLSVLMLVTAVPFTFAENSSVKSTTVSIEFYDIDQTATFESAQFVAETDGSFLISATDFDCPRGYYYYPSDQAATVTVTNGVPNFASITFVVKKFGVAGGDGSSKLPYVILTADDLDSIREHTAWNYIMGNDLDYSKGHSMEYPPAPYFSGVLDGNGCTITGIWTSCNDIENEGEYALFIENYGTIRNLNFEDCCFQGAYLVAMIAGKNYGVIENCHVTEGSYYAWHIKEGYDAIAGDGGYLGGIAAINYSSGKIVRCSVTNTYFMGCHGPYQGGLVGCNFGRIEECYTEFNPMNRYQVFDVGMIYVGGLVGGNMPGGVVKNSYGGSSYGETYAINGTAGVGGLIGANAGSVICSGAWNQDIYVYDITTSHNCIGYSQNPETLEYVYYMNTDGCDSSNWERGTPVSIPELTEGHILEGWSSDVWLFRKDYWPMLRWQDPTYVDVTFTVRFLDFDNTVLKTETVREGDSATAPADPVRDQYAFLGWSVRYENIIADTDVYATYWQLGDVNRNSGIDSGDATLVLRHCVELATLTDAEKKIGDVTQDGNITTGDAVLILRYATGLITEF